MFGESGNDGRGIGESGRAKIHSPGNRGVKMCRVTRGTGSPGSPTHFYSPIPRGMNFGSPRFPDSPPIIPRFPEYWKISGKNLKISKKIRKFHRKQNNLGEDLKKGKFSFIFILFGCVFKKLYFYSIYSTKNSSLKSC